MTTKMWSALLDAFLGRPNVYSMTREIHETMHRLRPRETELASNRTLLTRRETEMLITNLGIRHR